MLTGELPFGDRYQKCRDEKDFAGLNYTSTYRLNPLVPVWLDLAIQRTLSLDAETRYPALSEFAADINKPNPEFEGRRWPDRGSGNMALWKGAVVLLAVVNLLLVWIMVAG